MRRLFTILACGVALLLGTASPSTALDTFYEGTLKDAKRVAVGQTFNIGGWVEYTQRNGKTRAKITPLEMRIDSFAIADPKGFCVGTPEFPTYCDDFVGGYIPSYSVELSAQNKSKRALQAPTATLLCASTTGGTAQYFNTSGTMPKRTRTDETVIVALPREIVNPAECINPVLVLTSPFQLEAKQDKPMIPMTVFVSLADLPLS